VGRIATFKIMSICYDGIGGILSTHCGWDLSMFAGMINGENLQSTSYL
jgi:hypothetical protein